MLPYTPPMHHHDGNNDDNGQKQGDEAEEIILPESGDIGDDAGTRIGQGHDPVEDDVT